MKTIKIIVKGHKITAYQEHNQVWITTREQNRYDLYNLCGVSEYGMVPIMDNYTIVNK